KRVLNLIEIRILNLDFMYQGFMDQMK
ncbi:hypothetical protein A2U01_0093499, partial [Trifolium medium]|nr:hypothetical protein [Trifolium medium]